MKAAELGDHEAMLNLEIAYEGGLGVEKNYGKAFRWYQKAYEPEYCKSEAETRIEELLNKF
jgi:TPR repeat protein